LSESAFLAEAVWVRSALMIRWEDGPRPC